MLAGFVYGFLAGVFFMAVVFGIAVVSPPPRPRRSKPKE